MGSDRFAVCTVSLFCSLLMLMVCPAAAASYPVLRSEDSLCPEDWAKLAGVCWTRVPRAFMLTQDIARDYCHRRDAKLLLADDSAFCYNSGLQDVRKNYYLSTVDIQRFKKRVMGNNGL